MTEKGNLNTYIMVESACFGSITLQLHLKQAQHRLLSVTAQGGRPVVLPFQAILELLRYDAYDRW